MSTHLFTINRENAFAPSENVVSETPIFLKKIGTQTIIVETEPTDLDGEQIVRMVLLEDTVEKPLQLPPYLLLQHADSFIRGLIGPEGGRIRIDKHVGIN